MERTQKLLNMKASAGLPCFLKSRKSRLCHLLVLVFIVPSAARESSPQSKYEGVIGGNITFYCPVDDPQKLQLLYFQKGNIFVNGYYRGKSVPPTWPNTRVDDSESAVHMYGLNVSHSGEYKWIYMYINSSKGETKVKLQLLVTAPFSKPFISKKCEQNNDACNVTCESHNGYPRQQITWQMASVGSQMWKELVNEVLTNPTTQLLNISSTRYINCSSGEVNVSCSVGSIFSDVISVCAPPPSSIIHFTVKIALAIIISVVVLLIVAFGIEKYKRQKKARRATTDDQALEGASLAGNARVEEAP